MPIKKLTPELSERITTFCKSHSKNEACKKFNLSMTAINAALGKKRRRVNYYKKVDKVVRGYFNVTECDWITGFQNVV